MSKFQLDFDGIEILSKRFEDMGGNIDDLAAKALTATHAHVTPKVQRAMQSSRYNFNRTGKTKSSLRKTAKVEKDGTLFKVGVGFDIDKGGLPSVFLMRGTKLHGSPLVAPDRGLYNAIFGTATKKEVQSIQKDIFMNEILKG